MVEGGEGLGECADIATVLERIIKARNRQSKKKKYLDTLQYVNVNSGKQNIKRTRPGGQEGLYCYRDRGDSGMRTDQKMWLDDEV